MGSAKQLELFPDIPTWEERLKRRQEELSGKPADRCLVVEPAHGWCHYGSIIDRILVAVMCLKVHPECEACYNTVAKTRS